MLAMKRFYHCIIHSCKFVVTFAALEMSRNVHLGYRVRIDNFS